MAKIFKWFYNILFIIIIICLLGYYLLRITNKVEIYNVKTGSMEQKIHIGDYILILRKKEYKVGDVVTYTSDNGFITHRIIKIDGDNITTKGDANNTEDMSIKSNIIVGKVILSGGILNIVIKYKYIFVGLFLSLYLFSCYFESTKKEKCDTIEKDDEINIKHNNKDKVK